MRAFGVSRARDLGDDWPDGYTFVDCESRRRRAGVDPAGPRCARAHRHRQEPPATARRLLPARARPPSHRGRPRRRQDDARARARKGHGPELPANSVHERSVTRRRARRLRVPARQRPIRVPQGTRVLAARARRRDQPRDAEGPERLARGHGGTTGHRRRDDLRAARSVLRRRHAQSGAPDRHVSAAGIAARSLPHADRARLSRPER